MDLVAQTKSTTHCTRFTYCQRYLYELAEALRELSPQAKDRHVWDLEDRVRELERQDASKELLN